MQEWLYWGTIAAAGTLQIFPHQDHGQKLPREIAAEETMGREQQSSTQVQKPLPE